MAPTTEENDQGSKKRGWHGNGGPQRKKAQKQKPVKEGSSEEVLIADVRALFAAQKLSSSLPLDAKNDVEIASTTTTEGGEKPIGEQRQLPERFSEIEVKVVELSSTGDGLAVHDSSDHIYVVPFAAPGDILKVRVVTQFERDQYSLTDFISVVEASPLRNDAGIKCQYFGKCSGCQFQHLDYETQLKHKKMIVEKAYKNFSNLPPELLPVIQDTMGSPLQYGYRTKLTPHFDGPPGSNGRGRNKPKTAFEKVPEIGFNQKGRRIVLDIEDCPIATDAVRMGMKNERTRVAKDLMSYKRGATLLLRESTKRIFNSESKDGEEEATPPNSIKETSATHTDYKTYVTDNNGTSTEYIDNFVFTNIAGSFFQNNNSILPSFTQYIREHALPPNTIPGEDQKIKYLIDAYSGSGLFTITLSSIFKSSTGIDISKPSIQSAEHNASLNALPTSRCTFLAADAPELFKSVQYPADETVVVIDPPRKGCDESFLGQLLKFGPTRVVYVSCNVHTQARDVGVLVVGKGGTRYEIESLRGFDFFPQTGHVEGVAVLTRVDRVKEEVKIKAEAS